jgi:hypothetical protein
MAITLTSSSGAVTYSDTSAGFAETAGKYWIGDRGTDVGQHDLQDVAAAGVSGVGVVKPGFRRRMIGPLRVCYVNTSVANVRTAYESDYATLKNLSITASIDSSSYVACYLVGFKMVRPIKKGTSKYNMMVDIMLEQKRES